MVGRRLDQRDVVVSVGEQSVASEPVVDVQLAGGTVVRLALRRARHVAPPARHRAEHGASARLRAASARAAASAEQSDAVGSGERRGEGGEPVAVEEARVGVAGEERRMAQHADEQVAVGDDAVEPRPGERPGERPGGLVAGRRVADHLGEQRVVVDAHRRAGHDAGVEANPWPPESANSATTPGTSNVCSVPLCGCQPAAGSSA